MIWLRCCSKSTSTPCDRQIVDEQRKCNANICSHGFLQSKLSFGVSINQRLLESNVLAEFTVPGKASLNVSTSVIH